MAERYGKWIKPIKLGKGGQAQTFLVVEEGAEEKGQFVLKRLLNPARIERHRKEIEACQKLSHPNIVKIRDHDLNPPKPYLVVEYCKGGDLESSGIHSLEIIDRLKTFAQICRGVGHAHSNGIVHRDLKPANIFLREDKLTPIVGDFGICFFTDGGERVTLLDEVAGARWYVAPELEDGRLNEVSPASDVYSLGKLLYWMLAGRIFSREKHRDPQYDLTQTNKDTAIFLVYGLLDKTIHYNISNRLMNANEVANEIELIIKRVNMNSHAIDLSVPQHCIYCAIGEYKAVVNPYSGNSSQQQNVNDFLRIQHADNNLQMQTWLVLACDYCGNVQIFRPDKAKNRDIWKKK